MPEQSILEISQRDMRDEHLFRLNTRFTQIEGRMSSQQSLITALQAAIAAIVPTAAAAAPATGDLIHKFSVASGNLVLTTGGFLDVPGATFVASDAGTWYFHATVLFAVSGAGDNNAV